MSELVVRDLGGGGGGTLELPRRQIPDRRRGQMGVLSDRKTVARQVMSEKYC